MTQTACQVLGVYTVERRGGGGWGAALYDVTGGNCVLGEISVHVSAPFLAQNKPVNKSFVDFCGAKCISE